MTASKKGLFREQLLAKETQETLNAVERKRAKTEHMEIVLNGLRKASAGAEIRAAANGILTKKGKGKGTK